MSSILFSYADWSCNYRVTSSKASISSGGLATKTSNLYKASAIIGNISARVNGGYAWCAAHNEGGGAYGDSLATNLTVNIYLVTEGGQRLSKATASGAAGKGGELNLHDHRTSGTCSYNPSNMTAEEKALYKYVQLEYTCRTSQVSAEVDKYDSYGNGDAADPWGDVSLTLRDTINTFLDETEMTELYYDGDEVDTLYYDGDIVF